MQNLAAAKALAAIDAALPGRVRATALDAPELCLHEVSFRGGGRAYVDLARLRAVCTCAAPDA